MLFLVLALVAYILGARGIAGFSMDIAKWIIIVFIIAVIVSFILQRIPERKDKIGSGDALQEKIVHLLIYRFFPQIRSKKCRTYQEYLHYP